MSTPSRPWIPAGVRAAAVLAALFVCAPLRAEDPPPAPAPTASETTVKLLEAGAEPRVTLRSKAAKGLREKMKFTMKNRTKVEGAENPAQVMGMEITSEVKDVLPNGDRQCEMILGAMTMDVGADEQTKGKIDRMLATVDGTRVSLRVTERLESKDPETVLPPGIDPMMAASLGESMNQMGELGPRVLPEEAVGVGARWELKHRITQNGITLDQVGVYTLKSFEKDRMTLDFTLTQAAKDQTMKNEAMGFEVQVVSMNSKGTGSMEFDLKRLIPAKATITLESKMEMKMSKETDAPSTNVEASIELSMVGEVLPVTAPAKPDPK